MNETTRRISDFVWPILGVVALVLLGFLGLNACVMMTKPIPNRFQLGSLRAGHQSFATFWPYGHHHELILGVPGGEWNHPPDVSGFVRFQNGEEVPTEVVVQGTNAVSSNWLQPRELQGFILTWPNTNDWEHSLVPGRTYAVHCEFTGGLPSNSTLWVSCLQSGIDRWKTRRNRTTPPTVR